MIKVDDENNCLEWFFTHFLRSGVAFKKARQSLYIPTLKYVQAYRLEHFHRPQRRERKRHTSLYSWFCHVFLTVFGGSKQKIDNVSRNLIVLLRWGAENAIQKTRFHRHRHRNSYILTFPCLVTLLVCISIFMVMAMKSVYFHELASFVHKSPGWV